VTDLARVRLFAALGIGHCGVLEILLEAWLVGVLEILLEAWLVGVLEILLEAWLVGGLKKYEI
jgi:hypothetical protein